MKQHAIFFSINAGLLLIVLLCISAVVEAQTLNPTIINGDVILCPGGNETLITQEYDTYQWYKNGNPVDGATAQSHTVSYSADVGANFSVYVTQGDESDMSPSILVDGYVFMPLVVSSYGQGYWYTGDGWEMCKDDELFFEVMSPYTNNVQWFRNGNPIEGANNPIYQVDQTGIYTVRGSPSLCPNYVQYSIGLPVEVHQPPQPEITQQADTLFTSLYPGQWYAGLMPIPGATGEFLIPESNGYYSFRYTDDNGCTSISESYYYEWDPVGLGHASLAHPPSVKIIENQLYIKNAEGYMYRIYNLSGMLLGAGIVGKEALDVSAWPSGLYLVHLQQGEQGMSWKIMKE
jgi:hypothetical protein